VKKNSLLHLYPLLIVIFAISLMGIKYCHAGRIRNLVLSQDHPGTVYFAMGKATRLSFPTRPEKLVPGSPGHLTLDFVTANDISIIPLSRDIGNLHIYTAAGDYVLLFQLANASNYDDAVNIKFGNTTRPMRLLEDSYHAERLTFSLRSKDKKQKETTVEAPILSRGDGLRFEGTELLETLKTFPHLRCPSCVITKKNDSAIFICVKNTNEMKCEDGKNTVTLRRAQ
jgi:hypothetical protein